MFSTRVSACERAQKKFVDLDRKVVFSLGGDLQLLRFGEPHFKWSKCTVYSERVVTLPTTTLGPHGWPGCWGIGYSEKSAL